MYQEKVLASGYSWHDNDHITQCMQIVYKHIGASTTNCIYKHMGACITRLKCLQPYKGFLTPPSLFLTLQVVWTVSILSLLWLLPKQGGYYFNFFWHIVLSENNNQLTTHTQKLRRRMPVNTNIKVVQHQRYHQKEILYRRFRLQNNFWRTEGMSWWKIKGNKLCRTNHIHI